MSTRNGDHPVPFGVQEGRTAFYHPVIEGALKAALSQLHAKVDTRNLGPIAEVALAADQQRAGGRERGTRK